MTKERALEELRELANIGNWEYAHGKADEILCELLRSLGYDDIADAFDAVGKWYA